MRPEEEDDPFCTMKQNTYTRRRRRAKYEKFIKTFLKRDQVRLN